MHSQLLLWLALGATAVTAFKDTSPFILFSTSEILASPPQVVTAASLSNIVQKELQKCPSDYYLFVSQPGVTAADYRSPNAFPHLRRWMSGDEKRIRSSFSVTDVLGEMDTVSIQRSLEGACGAKAVHVGHKLVTSHAYILNLKLPPINTGTSDQVYENGLKIDSILDNLPSPNFTVIYTTTPSSTISDFGRKSPTTDPSPGYETENTFSYETEDPLAYEMEEPYSYSSHLEMKRDLSAHPRATNSTRDTRPLFEKYQFFTPGIFMGLIVAFVLLPILYVAISGVASLEVSYAAFDKEMGPAAQKKQ